MEKTLVISLENHNIYYLTDSSASFYIAIPYKKFSSSNITIELRDDTLDLVFNTSNMGNLVNKLNDIYSKIDNYNISLIIPVINNNFLNSLNTNPDERLFSSLDKALGTVINYSYMALSENNIKVESNIIMVNNNKYSYFMRWFMQKYQNRCQYKTIMEMIMENNQDHLDKVSSSGINFVVGREETPNLEPINDNKMQLDSSLILDEVEIDEDNIPVRKEAHQAGYISYYLLGVISIAVSLVVLYLLLWKKNKLLLVLKIS